MAADNEDVLLAEFQKIEDESQKIYSGKTFLKSQIHQLHNRYKDMGNNVFEIFCLNFDFKFCAAVPFEDNVISLTIEEGEVDW